MRILRVVLLISIGAVLVGCGADGEPIQPTISASVGVGTSGAYGGVGVSVRHSGSSIFLGL